MARTHRQAVRQLRALLQLGVNHWLTEGRTPRLRKARQQADAFGATSVGVEIDVRIAFCHILNGEYAMAAARIPGCLEEARRLGLDEVERYALLAQATLAAHQARRPEMDKALVELARLGGGRSRLAPLGPGLARTFCALLEEDADRARRELAEAIHCDVANPATFPIAGRNGLHLLLEVVAGRAGRREYEEVTATPASRLRWNRQFVMFAHAVLLGREGRAAEAAAAVLQAERAAAAFAVTLHLGLRLVAETAITDGWGQPSVWLRRAEEYFHDASIPAPVIACRALLRLAGTPVPQRRGGMKRVPAALRKLGVTVREYEVLQLLADRPSNKAIADRLHISPRTVEKHMANLVLKIGQSDRVALCEFAKAFADPATGPRSAG